MKMSEMFSKYLSAEDLKDPQTGQYNSYNLTIKSVTMEELGEHKERKPVLHFHNSDRGMVLNITNAIVLEGAYGGDSDYWIGKAVTLYYDPNVMFGTKRTGGLRIQPLGQTQALPQQQPQPAMPQPQPGMIDHQAPLPGQTQAPPIQHQPAQSTQPQPAGNAEAPPPWTTERIPD